MRRNLQKIRLLLWKNYTVQKRHPIRTVLEFTLPLLITFVLVVLRDWVKPLESVKPIIYPPVNIDICGNITGVSKQWDLAWSPSTDDTARKIVEKIMEKGNYKKSHAFLNANEMDRNLFDVHMRNVVLAGISFDDSILSNKSFSSHPKVTLRFPGLSRIQLPNTTTLDTQIPNWRTHLVFPLYQSFGPRDSLSLTGGEPGYCEEGFLKLQNEIFTAILHHYKENPRVPDFVVTRFPYPKYTVDALLPALISFISIFLLISFVFTAINTIKLVTTEKESQMKEAMKLMGIPNWMHWTAWYIKELVQWIIPIIAITFLLTHKWSKGYIIARSDPYLIFLVLVLYAIASIAFCFLVSVCFNKANSAATIGGALWFLQYSPYLILQPKYVTMTWGQVMLCSLLSNTNMGYLWQLIVTYEGTDEGLQWKNMFEPVSPSDKVSVIDLMTMLIVDSVIYMLMAIYIEGVFPGKHGISMPWYFPFQATYWFGYKKDLCDIRPIKGIQIKNLSKTFDNKTVAVQNLNLDLYPNQITVLLGHNGAGKSTTMSILTGLIRPTSGTATINGYDIWSDMDRIRDDLGLCPQYNLLFRELTIKEHLQFFGTLKEAGKEDLDMQIKKYVSQLDLESKLNDQAHTLSGGYKRRLSVAIALAGKSKVVLLDEPTSGMDPSARRCLWDLLQAERYGRTVVMTTHLMDEADVLGDRVAIMKSGQLKCIGTPFSLKKEYGRGYTLSLVKSKNEFRDEKVTLFLQSFYSDIYPTCNTENEVKYCIDDPKHFPDLLSVLSKEQDNLGIKAYGISLTTMEDVYMRVGVNKKLPDVTVENTSNNISISNLVPLGKVTLPPSMCPLIKSNKNKSLRETWRCQFYAMLKKKMLVSLRSWFLHFCQILITFTFLVIALIVSISWRGNNHLKPLDLSLKQYRDPVVIIVNNTGDESFDRINTALLESLQYETEVMYAKPGNFADFLLPKYSKGVYEINQRYILGIDIINWRANLHFNAQPYHSLPTILNLFYNAIMKDNLDSDHEISFINHPLQFLPSEMVAKFEGGSNLGFQVAFNMGFAQAFVCAIFLLITVKESETGAKHLQFISGVNPAIYWLASVLWDYVIYTLPILTLFGTFFLYNDDAFTDSEQIVRIILLMGAFNWAFLPVTNLLSYFFHTPSLAFTAVSLLNILTGCSTVLLVLILEMRPLKLVAEAEVIDSIMIFFPHYALCSGLRYIYLSYDMAAACKGDLSTLDKECHEWKGDHYSWTRPGIGRHLFFMALVGLIGNLLLLNIEFIISKWKKFHHIFATYYISLRSRPGADCEMKLENPHIDETDVASEKHVAQKCLTSEYSIVMNNVWKLYGKFQAVKDINLALKPFECFALLGSNGAGKTSTFKMLTCKSDISTGNIFICSLDVRKQKHEVSRIIGYCPQFDALINQLTGRETLKMFCTLRGIPESEQSLIISQLASRLILHKFLDVKIGDCSGGNKRKFSTAVAMIGDPPVLLLDEPTSGMDPDARRHLWDAINEERERGKCILITTHSLEECEELCTRLAIMVDGEIRCIGSVQHLKSKYATGYKLHIKFPANSRQNIKLAIQAYLPGSKINEEYEGMIVFHIPKEVACSKVFNIMEKAKMDSLIEDYSIQQTSLEQVFLQLTQK